MAIGLSQDRQALRLHLPRLGDAPVDVAFDLPPGREPGRNLALRQGQSFNMLIRDSDTALELVNRDVGAGNQQLLPIGFELVDRSLGGDRFGINDV